MKRFIFTSGLLFAVALSGVPGVRAQTNTAPPAPARLPGRGLKQHDFFYAGEGKLEQMFIVRGGKVAESYLYNGRGEISDATLMANGDILFAHQFGVTEISADRRVVWNYDAPTNTEIHTAQPIGINRVWFIENGDPAKLVVMEKATGTVEREFVLPVGNPKGTHGQFRHARLTDAGTLLVAHMDLGRVCEYDATGKELWSIKVPGIWSVAPLKNGNILTAGRQGVAELNRKGDVVWKWVPADTPAYRMSSVQQATRLPNGNTLINNWFNEWSGKVDPTNAPVQAIEITHRKKVVWALRSWSDPDLGPSTTIQVLDKKSVPENVRFGEFK
jgi:hypothetical protein